MYASYAPSTIRLNAFRAPVKLNVGIAPAATIANMTIPQLILLYSATDVPTGFLIAPLASLMASFARLVIMAICSVCGAHASAIPQS